MSKNGKNLILDYLVERNKPLSASDLCNNLNGQVSKSSVIAFLEELASEKKINEKTYGKQKVYMAVQNTDCSNIKHDLRALDEKIFTVRSELNMLKNENSKYENELKSYSVVIPSQELERNFKALENNVEKLKSCLLKFKSVKTEHVSKEEKIKITREHEKYVKEWRKLKRISNEMIYTILENCTMKKIQLIDDLGLVLDEHEKVEPPKI